MLYRLRQRLSNEGGFTLIELLVVILIIGILAAIAIPAFLSQTSKANDSAAKTQVGTLQTTMEAYAAENQGSFTGGSLAELQKIEPTLNDTTTATAQATSTPTSEEFEVASIAKGSLDEYKLKNAKGTITRTCKPVSKGSCPASGTW
jgi:type IV pilus assembly protein PilA